MAAPRSQALHVARTDCFLLTRQLPDDSRRKLNILLAEDDPVNRVLAQKLLQKQGHAVTSVNKGRETVQRWEQNRSHQFDVILMDVQVPQMDGLQASSLIREKELTTGAHTPIIALTAHAIKGDRERCLAAGADGYITKPINPAELVETIQVAFRNGAKLPAVQADPLPEGPSDAELPARFDGDGELLKELAGIFLQECPKMLDDIREALHAGNPNALERAAPTLKGAVGNFAMPGPRETAQRLELLAKSGKVSGAKDILHTLEQQLVLFKNTAEPAHQPS
jgi:two-component system sensor histidine kinase/response regulator